MAGFGKGRGRGRGSAWSVSFDAPDIGAIVREQKENAQRECIIEAAEEAAAKEGFGDDWEIDVELNMDDGQTIDAVVVKKADGEPQITEWKAQSTANEPG